MNQTTKLNDQTCSISFHRRSFMPTYCTFLFLFSIVTALGCEEKRDVVILGEVRDPDNNCEATLVEFEIRVTVQDVVPQLVPPDWCAVMDGSPELVCFLHENNTREWSHMDAPRALPHIEATSTHPDLDCWKEELADWDDASDNDGGSAGEASSNDGYHPIYNNE